MKIAVFVKSVPNPEQYGQIKLDPVKKTVIREGVESVLSGTDSLAANYTLAKAAEKIGVFDLYLLGNASDDGATAHVPSQLRADGAAAYHGHSRI